MIETVKVFHYKIVAERPIDQLQSFASHHRLRVFCNKGTTCVTCGKVGTRLIQGEGRGRTHWDIYTDDLYPLTVDHIIPRSLGGCDELENLQPMCAGCNFKKGNGIKSYSIEGEWIPKGYVKCSYIEDLTSLIGKSLFKRVVHGRRQRRYLRECGVLTELVFNEKLKRVDAVIDGRSETLISFKNLFIPQESL